MTPDRNRNWPFIVTWAVLLAALGCVGIFVALLIERFIARYGPWVLDHADWIFAVVVTVCIIALAVLAVAERAKKDNPSW